VQVLQVQINYKTMQYLNLGLQLAMIIEPIETLYPHFFFKGE